MNQPSFDQLLREETSLIQKLQANRRTQAAMLHAHRQSLQTMAPAQMLTPTEESILRLIRRTKQNKEIAADLHMSVRTVKFHVTNLLRKFGTTDRYHL